MEELNHLREQVGRLDQELKEAEAEKDKVVRTASVDAEVHQEAEQAKTNDENMDKIFAEFEKRYSCSSVVVKHQGFWKAQSMDFACALLLSLL